MLKKIVLSCIFLIPATVFSQTWQISSEGYGYLTGTSKEKSLRFALNGSESGGYLLFFSPPNPGFPCPSPDSPAKQAESLHINGVKVQMEQACVRGVLLISPKTHEGANHVLDQFISKKDVVILRADKSYLTTFNARGFTKAFNEYNQKRGGL